MTPGNEFDELEARMRRRPMPALPSDLRDRLLADVAKIAESTRRLSWPLAAGIAAAVAVGLNVVAMTSHVNAGPVAPRLLPPPGMSVASTDPGAVAPRLGSPWLPCDLPGGR